MRLLRVRVRVRGRTRARVTARVRVRARVRARVGARLRVRVTVRGTGACASPLRSASAVNTPCSASAARAAVSAGQG